MRRQRAERVSSGAQPAGIPAGAGCAPASAAASGGAPANARGLESWAISLAKAPRFWITDAVGTQSLRGSEATATRASASKASRPPRQQFTYNNPLVHGMKIKDEIKIKGDADEVLEKFEEFIDSLKRQNCDRFTIKIKSKAWNEAEHEAEKADDD